MLKPRSDGLPIAGLEGPRAEISRRQFVHSASVVGLGVLATGSGLMSLSGCTSAPAAEVDENHQLITDYLDRDVVVPIEPQGLAAVDAFSGEALIFVGAASRLTAIQRGSRGSVLLSEAYPGIMELPNFMLDGSVNIETLLASDTDVLLTKESVFSSPGEVEKLEKTGVPCVVVDYHTIDEQISAIELIGQVCGGESEARADALVEYYRSVVARVEDRAASVPENKRVTVYHSMNVAVKTDGGRSIGSDWIARTGAVNVASGAKGTRNKRDYQTSLEEVFLWDPDVIICNDPETAEYFRTDSKWVGLRAIREDRVYQLPVGATRWGHMGSIETYLAMLWLGTTLYPDLYADVNLREEVVGYYRTHLGIEVDDRYEMILSGVGLRNEREGDANA